MLGIILGYFRYVALSATYHRAIATLTSASYGNVLYSCSGLPCLQNACDCALSSAAFVSFLLFFSIFLLDLAVVLNSNDRGANVTIVLDLYFDSYVTVVLDLCFGAYVNASAQSMPWRICHGSARSVTLVLDL
jgi:hypothetical protein